MVLDCCKRYPFYRHCHRLRSHVIRYAEPSESSSHRTTSYMPCTSPMPIKYDILQISIDLDNWVEIRWIFLYSIGLCTCAAPSPSSSAATTSRIKSCTLTRVGSHPSNCYLACAFAVISYHPLLFWRFFAWRRRTFRGIRYHMLGTTSSLYELLMWHIAVVVPGSFKTR
ncbi:hypothetical protein BDN70DRAFT_595093 [Pholiota conissans]|uniref:Uncharacterized protein n=1 Tax=Pholiota conissans TaxID=109636 RepID=A0A9P6D1U6_9AGAR|nr:hypothetical protein BDN70DRAFT_595093 [Pholiota conissans]